MDPIERVARQLAILNLYGLDALAPRQSHSPTIVGHRFSCTTAATVTSTERQRPRLSTKISRYPSTPVFSRPQRQITAYVSPSSSSSYESGWSSSTSPLSDYSIPTVPIGYLPVTMVTPPHWTPAVVKTTSYRFCAFCKNNGESQRVYEGHELRDHQGRVTCPYLFRFTCPICGATGDNAHTESYCPKRSPDAPVSIARIKTPRTSCGKTRRK